MPCRFCDSVDPSAGDCCTTCDEQNSSLADLYESTDPVELSEIQRHGSRLAIKQAVDGGSMSADFIIVSRSSNEPNLHGNMVQIGKSKFGDGVSLKYHEIARPVLLEHGMDFPHPIGVSEDQRGRYSVKKVSKALTATVMFSQVLPEAELVFAMLDEGTIRMASIGFRINLAMKLKTPPQKALETGVEDWTWGRGHDFVETLLLEWSIVHSGADTTALRQHLEHGKVRGVRIPETLKRSFERYAEPRRPQGRGFELPATESEKKPVIVPKGVDASLSINHFEPRTLEIDALTIGQRVAGSLADLDACRVIGNEIADSL